MHDVRPLIAEGDFPPLRRRGATTLQVNLGYRCNQSCVHCHVAAGPHRTESMSRETAHEVLELLRRSDADTLDVTGGAPELNPVFRELVAQARALGTRVIDRCNLTVLLLPEQAGTAEFLAEHEVRVVASLPCYSKQNVDAQRGRDVFERSIEALRRLNRLGYGLPDSVRRLDLVYNPQGPSLPPPQAELEARYRDELRRGFGIEFHALLAITNMPIKRFAHALAREGREAAYLALLVNHFNPETLPGLMCRETLSVGWDGELYDCDFNQMLELPLAVGPRTVFELEDLDVLEGAAIATAPHCFGCISL